MHSLLWQCSIHLIDIRNFIELLVIDAVRLRPRVNCTSSAMGNVIRQSVGIQLKLHLTACHNSDHLPNYLLQSICHDLFLPGGISHFFKHRCFWWSQGLPLSVSRPNYFWTKKLQLFCKRRGNTFKFSRIHCCFISVHRLKGNTEGRLCRQETIHSFRTKTFANPRVSLCDCNSNHVIHNALMWFGQPSLDLLSPLLA